ncbi:ribosomal-processing cysteine protease Prp [Ureaplasma parvum]|uniref:ribosomal-processing cysteine protease Prp n=1 Tax=Ureaplasma parvum TaxID=134821 RepID=UPI0026EC91DA|nr:ribosomal-processing cysteine protease Prp [Ureaplasma parvum]
MIKINHYPNALLIKGHANYSEYGTDIVCAGVSAIVMGALNWFDQQKTTIKIDKGFILIIVDNHNQLYCQYLKLIMLQLKAIFLKYQSYIELHEYKQQYKRGL